MAGYISSSDPTYPVIKDTQFGTPTLITQPTNVGITQSFTPPKLKKITATTSISSLVSPATSTLYTLIQQTTFMLTGLVITTQYVSGTVPEGRGVSIGYTIRSGGTTEIAFIFPNISVVAASNAFTMTFPIPLALNYDDVVDIFLQSDDNSFSCHANICGYIVNN